MALSPVKQNKPKTLPTVLSQQSAFQYTPDKIGEMFGQYGVDPSYGANPGETSQQRLSRISNQLNSGERTVDNLYESLGRLGTRAQQSNPQRGTAYAGPNIQADIRRLFNEAGVPISGSYSGSSETEQARLDRITREIQGGRSLGNVSESISRLAGQMDPTYREANMRVGAQFNGQEQAIRQAMDLFGQQNQRDLQAQQLFGQYGQGEIENTFQTLSNLIARNSASTQGSMQEAQRLMESGYADAGQAVQGAAGGFSQGMANNAQGLGIEAAIPSAVSPMNADASFYGSQLQSGAQTDASSQNMLRNVLAGIGNQAVTDTGLESAQQQGNFQTALMQTLGDIGVAGAEGSRDFLNQLNNLQGERGSAMAEMLAQLGERNYERQWNREGRDLDINQMQYERGRNTTLDQLAAEIQRGTLGLQQSELGFQQDRFNREFGLSQDRFGLEQQLGLGGLDIDRQRLGLDQQLADLEAGKNPELSGRGGLDQYLQTNYMSPTSINWFNQAANAAREAAAGSQGLADPVSEGMRWLEDFFGNRIENAPRPGAMSNIGGVFNVTQPGFDPSTARDKDQIQESWNRLKPQYQTMLEILFGQY